MNLNAQIKNPRVLLVIPPFLQMNSTYPSVTTLCGFLKSNDIYCKSFDLSLEVILKLFNKNGLKKIFNAVDISKFNNENIKRIYWLRKNYMDIIDLIISFLQGRNLSQAYNILQPGFLPEANYFKTIDETDSSFGEMSIIDRAKHYCSLVIDDLTDFIHETISENFGLSRYAEKVVTNSATFDIIEEHLHQAPNIIEQLTEDLILKKVKKERPDFIGFTIPFPGNLLGALIAARKIKKHFPSIKIIFGGGYVNTELRSISDNRIFQYCDFITLDDGELPFLNIIKNYSRKKKEWVRTYYCKKNKIVYSDNSLKKNIAHDLLPCPSYDGIDVKKYFSMTEMLNPMHKIWSDGFWIKLTIAHGCYWRKCTFCDVTLDYIGRYSPAKAKNIVDNIEKLIRETGITSFHFTDEAAPPVLLKEISLELIRRDIKITWWTNIRFEKSFTEGLCKLMSHAGCVAVSGGLEVADERILKLINKGITLEQTARVCYNFQKAGIMIHAYLMFGFPSQTNLELVNSLEYVRQFFQNRLIQSGFWHQFILTIHSPIAKNAAKYKIEIVDSSLKPFANNNISHIDYSNIDYEKFSPGLKKAIYNFMHGIGFGYPLQYWFDFIIPETTINPNSVQNMLDYKNYLLKLNEKVIWIAGEPIIKTLNKNKVQLIIHTNDSIGEWILNSSNADWIMNSYLLIKNNSIGTIKLSDLVNIFKTKKNILNKFFNSREWLEIKEISLITF